LSIETLLKGCHESEAETLRVGRVEWDVHVRSIFYLDYFKEINRK